MERHAWRMAETVSLAHSPRRPESAHSALAMITEPLRASLHEPYRFPISRSTARALGRDRCAEDRLQRPLPDVLRHRDRRLLARAGDALCADDGVPERRSVRAQGD